MENDWFREVDPAQLKIIPDRGWCHTFADASLVAAELKERDSRSTNEIRCH